MKDREKIDKKYRRAHLKRSLETMAAITFALVAWGTVAYLAYELPTRTRREYEILVRDYEWRRARLESPYRALEWELRPGCEARCP